MRNRLIRTFTKSKKGTLGYTLTEMLTVIGIIVVLLSIAIPSVISLSKSMKFAQRNDYAKSIFMAAQANLTEMRADGGLAPLQRAGLDSLPVQEELCGFPVEDWSPEYVYTSSEDSQKGTYDMVLPVGSVDGTLREQQVIIEYNPLTGNVYSVFYCEEELVEGTGKTLLDLYRDNQLPRNGEGDEKKRKEMMVGYYDGSGLSSAELEIERTEAKITFENGEEGIVTVHIPMPDLYVGAHNEFMKGLVVELEITPDRDLKPGETELPKISVTIKSFDTLGDNCKLAVDGKTVEVTYVLDSLARRQSFANLSSGTKPNAGGVGTTNNNDVSLTDLMSEESFNVLPGENVTLEAEVTFYAAEDRPSVAVQNAKLKGVNPMFEGLNESLIEEGKFTLTISNGRNLQNLNAIAPSVAENITSVVFTDDIYWNRTVAYYNDKYGTNGKYEGHKNGVYDEAPARALPYFVPIHNENLFGTATFIYPSQGDGGIGDAIGGILDGWIGDLGFRGKEEVPTFTDELDQELGEEHATISGGGHKIYNLNIDSTKYAVPNDGEKVELSDDNFLDLTGTFYATGGRQIVDYYFTGLFGYVNTTIDGLHVVNPIVKGYHFEDETKTYNIYGPGKIYLPDKGWHYPVIGTGTTFIYNSPATGALVGACGYNTLITNCSTYIDTSAASGFDRSKLTQADYNKDAAQNWYGVSGEGAVGGLVGYAKSHKTTTGSLTGDTKFLAFSNSFAAVNVSGNMRGNDNKDFGYNNGVGGLIGNSELTNFYNCYASGNVRANGVYVVKTDLGLLTNWIVTDIQEMVGADEILDLLYCGARSMGVGGFVGTSHGTRYTNCFSTGNVDGHGTNNLGAGGFVGVMSYEETFAFGNHTESTEIAQHTVFENCYAVGLSRENGVLGENFSGANARVALDLKTSGTYIIGNYYRALAPCYDGDLWGQAGGAGPDYQNFYIFKDSYYLSQHQNLNQDNSNRCATAESYQNLSQMHNKHQDASWINTQINTIKNIYLYTDPGWNLISSKDDKLIYYKEAYFDKHPNVLDGIYYEAYSGTVLIRNRATGNVEKQIQGGFLPTELGGRWTNISSVQTHPYSLARDGQAYPFSMINGLHYYGDWPYAPQYANIAYYEDYQDQHGNKSSTGYYFDSDATSTLRHDQDVLSDGYAIISANSNDTVWISINGGAKVQLICKDEETYNPGGITAVAAYYVYRIPASLYENLSADAGYYVTANVTVNGTGYTMYFNPSTAVSQIIGAAVKPEMPDEIYIRTARQLNALSEDRMQGIWSAADTTVIQQLNIDASVYDWNNDGRSNDNDVVPTLSTIGSEDHPFHATYTGTGGYVAQARIEGFEIQAPIFGYIGAEGSINHLAIQVDKNLTIGSAEDDYTALVAAVCGGQMENVDLTVTGNATLTANTAAGLLAGYVFGTEDAPANISGCDIIVEDLTITAENAGSVLGQAEFCDVEAGLDSEGLADDMSLTIEGSLTLNATEAGGFLGMSGDLDQDKTPGDVNVDGLAIEIHTINSTAARTGALVGTLEKGSIRNLTMNLDGSYTASNDDESTVIAGVAAVAKNATVQNVTVTIPGTISGDTAAGVFGTALALNVQTTEVTVSGTIQGAVEAAGMAASLEGGSCSGASVMFDNGKIKSDGRAAGFAVAVKGQVDSGLVTTLNVVNEEGALIRVTSGQIEGTTEAAGFACEITAQVAGSRVAGKLTVSAQERAAGFAAKITGNDVSVSSNGVTPALENTTRGYMGKSNAELSVSANTAALFAVEIGDGVNATNCYALGNVTGQILSGFADTNAGVIDGCSTNVTIQGGNAFVRDNTGAVTNSYGWYGNGNAEDAGTTSAVIETGTVTSSYFVDIDIPVTDECTSAEFYNDEGSHTSVSPLTLTAKELNGDKGSRWFTPEIYGQYPYLKLRPSQYPYPKLRVHYGNWATPPRYSYGIMYYEIYEDATWKMEIRDMSKLDPDMSELDNGVHGLYTYSNGAATEVSDEVSRFFNEEGELREVGYAVFFKDKTVGDNALPAGLSLTNATLGTGLRMNLSPNTEYTVYKLESMGYNVILKQAPLYEDEEEKSLSFNGWFAHEFETGPNHVVRHEQQLANVRDMEIVTKGQGSYLQTHDIELHSTFTTISNFSGTYDGGGRQIQKSGQVNQWMNGIAAEGKVLNVDLNLGDLTASFFGDVNGQLAVANINIGAVAEGANLINTLNGTVTFPEKIVVQGDLNGTVVGTVENSAANSWTVEILDQYDPETDVTTEHFLNGAVIDTVNSDANVTLTLVYDKNKEISGSIVNNVGGTFTLNDIHNFGTVSGSLFNTVSGTVTLSGGITVDTLSGSLVGTMNTNANVTTNAVNVTVLDGSLVYAFNDGTMTTGAVNVTTLNESLVYDFAGGTLTGTEISVINDIAVPVFADTLGGTVHSFTVKGDVTLGGNAKGALVNENNGTMTNLTLKTTTVTVEAAEDATIGTLVGTNNATLTGCKLEGTDDETVASVTITGTKGNALTFGGLVGENTGNITGTTEIEADITYIQPVAADSEKSATIGGLVGKMSDGTLENAYVTGSIDLTNIEQIKAAAAIAEAEEQGIELVEEPNPAPVDSNRSYIIGGAVGNLLAGSASETEANVAVVPAWKGASQVANANTFGTSGITNQGPVGMFVGFAGAVTIENCASIETTNETFQFLGEAMIGEVSYQDGTWVSTVKADSILSYTDSAYCNGNVYTSADSADITVIGKSAADKYTGIVTNLTGEDGCTFYLNGVQNYQSYGYDANTYSKANTAQNGYKTTQVTGSVTRKNAPRCKDLWDSNSTDGRIIETDYYLLYQGQYRRLGVKVSKNGLIGRTYEFAWCLDDGSYQIIGKTSTTPGHTRPLDEYRVEWDYKPEGYYTASVPSLDTSKQYLVVGPQGPYASTGNAGDGIVTVDFASSFRQRDEMYNAIWTLTTNGSAHTWTTVAHGLVFTEPNPGLSIPGKFTSPVVKYTINGAVCDLYIVEIDPALAYDKVVFTYAPATMDIREYIICKPVTAAANVTESDLPGESGEAPTAQEGNNN